MNLAVSSKLSDRRLRKPECQKYCNETAEYLVCDSWPNGDVSSRKLWRLACSSVPKTPMNSISGVGDVKNDERCLVLCVRCFLFSHYNDLMDWKLSTVLWLILQSTVNLIVDSCLLVSGHYVSRSQVSITCIAMSSVSVTEIKKQQKVLLLSTIGDWIFPVAAFWLWNTVPQNVMLAPSPTVFINACRLISSYFFPPISYSVCALLCHFGHYNHSLYLPNLLSFCFMWNTRINLW